MPTAKSAEPSSSKKPSSAKKSSSSKATKKSAENAAPSDLRVREGESDWSQAELDEVRAELTEEVAKHERTLNQAEEELQHLLHDSTDGAGRDAADVGSANFERDQEMSLAASAREMLEQAQLALEAIDNGTYGICESCGEPIGKGRLQVYPRATMCVQCKQRHERR